MPWYSNRFLVNSGDLFCCYLFLLLHLIAVSCSVDLAIISTNSSKVRILIKKEQKMAKENVEILPVIRERAQTNSPQMIPFTFSFVLWVFCLSMSTYVIVLCTTSYWLAKVGHDDKAEKNPPFSMPLYGILDSRIRTYYVIRSWYAFISVGSLCFIVRTLINTSKFRFPQILKDIVVCSKLEIDFIVEQILSHYLSKHTNNEDPLIVFAIAGCACFVSSCLAFITGPEPQSLFSILTTMFTCGISYASSKCLWKIVYSCSACHVCSFLLYLPIVLIKKEWVVKIFVVVLFYLLLLLLLVGLK